MQTLKLFGKLSIIAILLYCSWLMLLLSLPYTALRPNIDFLRTKETIYHILHWRYSFYIHVFTALFALVAGIFQFNRYIITKQKGIHHITGYVYLADVLFITGPASFIMALYANGGLPAKASFTILSLLWMLFTALAFRAVLKKRFIVHGSWMLRSYALTLSAITLRSYAYLIGLTHIDMRPVHIYIMIAWLSWIPNLLIAELLIKKGFIKTLLKK